MRERERESHSLNQEGKTSKTGQRRTPSNMEKKQHPQQSIKVEWCPQQRKEVKYLTPGEIYCISLRQVKVVLFVGSLLKVQEF